MGIAVLKAGQSVTVPAKTKSGFMLALIKHENGLIIAIISGYLSFLQHSV